jgi:hypothetical protein
MTTHTKPQLAQLPAPDDAEYSAVGDTAAGLLPPNVATLTPNVLDAIVYAFGVGATVDVAAGAALIARGKLEYWLALGRADLDAGREGTPYARLAIAASAAASGREVDLLAAVHLRAVGQQCRWCLGAGAFEGGENGGSGGENGGSGGENGGSGGVERCDVCRGTGWAVKPNGALALDLLSRSRPETYGKTERWRHEVTGRDGGPVQTVTAAVFAELDLTSMTPEQLRALAFGDVGDDTAPARDVIEAT